MSHKIISSGWIKKELCSVIFPNEMKVDIEYPILIHGFRFIIRKSPLNNLWIYKKKQGRITKQKESPRE